MSELNIKDLEKHTKDVLKAEIGALLFNLGKTHVGFWHEKNGQNYWNINFGINDEEKFKTDFKSNFGYLPFSVYRDYHKIANEINKTPFEYETEKSNLKEFIFNQKVKFPYKVEIVDKNNQQESDEVNLVEFIKGDSSKIDFIQKVFYRGCENINSGIDKGSPKEQLQGNLWISNAFGSFKKNVESQDFDDARICFYNKFHRFLSCNNYYEKPNWQEIRKFIFAEIENWYSRLLSDSRFPINDITLWDQAYMTASMFKAVLSNLVLNNSKLQNFQDNPSSIKWRILGIQYDKLGLAEKGFKPAHIDWYRSISEEIDDEIKKLLELKYPIGNEVYRDETGIYFIVGEDLGKDLGDDKGNLAILKDDLKEIKEEILQIFKEKSLDEFYPAIFLTKASRGLMNLTYLLENARENFLKADWSKKELDICLEKSLSGRARGICQVCKQRLVFEIDKRDENKNVCEICYKKTKGRVDKWVENRAGQTIWTAELKDKNDRLALVVMKFELMDWLNGDLLSSMLINDLKKLDSTNQNLSYLDLFGEMKKTLNCVKSLHEKNAFDINEYEKNKNNLNNFLKEVNSVLSNVGISFRGRYGLEYDDSKQIFFLDNNKLETILNNQKFKNFIKIFDFKIFNILSPDAYGSCKSNRESFDDYIRQVFFGSVIGTEWEEFIKEHISNEKIDWQKEKIIWEKLDEKDINFLATLLLQFLLRKNPSPARIRRIWESTKEFFEEIEEKLLCVANIPDDRRIRLYWEKDVNYEGEAVYNNLEFWIKDKKCYLITYAPELIEKNLKNKNEELTLKLENGETINLNLKDAKTEFYKPYMSIINPTPISWQFIIPAEYAPKLIKNIQNLYDKYFKYVYGKLPLHIGVIIQDYKKPLYIGISALRKIRRDVKEKEKLCEKIEVKDVKEKEKLCEKIEVKDFKEIFNDKIRKGKIEEQCNGAVEYYSLYFGSLSRGDYQFYVSPGNSPCWMKNVDRLNNDEKINYIPNTFDFEFLDTNTRRNDIYYGDEESENCKRKVDLKVNRPLNIEKHFDIFENFKEAFKEGSSTSKLHNIINIFYEKVTKERAIEGNETEDLDDGTKKFLASAMINILESDKSKGVRELIKKWLDIKDVDKITQEKITSLITKEKIKMFIDMFGFWHKALKEV